MVELTVIFPLYRAEDRVEALVDSLLSQTHPDGRPLKDWLQVVFIDNASGDGTVPHLQATLEARDAAWCTVVENPENLGLAGSLNKAFAMSEAPFALTCHVDCLFAQDDYLSGMLELIRSHPDVAAITGCQTHGPSNELPLVEKINLVTNLMDLLPPQTNERLVPVGFAEGRCDVFRIEALEQVGFYDKTFRLAGEDQLLAAKLRNRGWHIRLAPGLRYLISVSAQQNTVWRLISHQRMFGRAHPYIMMLSRHTRQGVIGSRSGSNRTRRALLRATQIGCATGYVAVLAALALARPGLALAAMLAVVAVKFGIFHAHMRKVQFNLVEMAQFWLLQPVFDISYTFGVAQGLWVLVRRPEQIT